MLNIAQLDRLINQRNGEMILSAEKIDIYDTLFMILSANGDGENSRTLLQKITYFCSNSIINIENMAFKPQYHGPYSAKVNVALEKMVSCGFLERVTIYGFNGKSNYRLTDDGKELANDAKGKYGKEYDKICSVVKTCHNEAEPKGTEPEDTKLSYAAKIHYISREHKTDSPDKISKYSKRYDWAMDASFIDKHFSLAMELDTGCKNNS
ncbi:hypothetical protein CENSYa_2029 [Cenarchaeum symbiosum A]|uniref:Uncharacterized protein n=1 Tax=Cenarchaeum symbiosum (strain A) TaxID=414004 RepID=A0RZ65_CENSY|nr:hypothetical protein CENSYa_2029 [Cenarchaeum symbiosum A]